MRKKTHWIAILNQSTGAVEHLQKFVLAGTDTLDMWWNNFLFQNLDNTAPTDITKYRVYIGFQDTTSMAAKNFIL